MNDEADDVNHHRSSS